MPNNPPKTIVLGDVADNELRSSQTHILQEMGGHVTSKMPWAPDTDVVTVEIGGQVVIMEADFGLGLSISGHEALVERIASRVKQERPR